MLTGCDEFLAYLDTLGIATTTTRHPPLFTVGESGEWHHRIAGHHAKNLFVKDKKSRIFLISCEAHFPLDLKHAHGAIGGSGRLSFGSAEAMFELLGVRPGAVTPFGLVNDRAGRITFVLHDELAGAEQLNFHPLDNTATTTIRRDDFLAFLDAIGHRPLVVALPRTETGGPEDET